MHKIMQLISIFLYRKNMFPFMTLHIHLINLMKKKSYEISKFLNFETKGYKGNGSF